MFSRLPPPIWVGLLCLVAVALVDAALRHESGLSGDEPFYTQMAAHPGGPHTFPYAYRIALPWLVHVLPFSHPVSFRVLAWLAIAASGGALYALLAEFEIDPRLAASLCLGFVLSPTLLVVLLRNGRSIDPTAILVMTLGCLFIVRRQKFGLALTILIGVAVKETSLFLIPLAYAVWAQRIVDREAPRDVVLIAAAPIVAYIVLRASVPAVGNQYTPGYTGSFLHIREEVFRKAFSGVELRRLAYTYGPLWVAAPFALRNLPFARRGLVLVALCVISWSVSYDASRIIFLAAPVFYVAGASAVRHRRALALATVIALFVVDIGYTTYMEAYGLKHGIENSGPATP